jgi:hypothetical protein
LADPTWNDTHRVDFHIQRRTTWYWEHREEGKGVLCFDMLVRRGSHTTLDREQVTAGSWRDAIDAAIAHVAAKEVKV